MTLLQENQVREMLGGCSTSTLHRIRKNKKFPAPYQLHGQGMNLWRSDEVEVWIEESLQRKAS